VSSMSEVSKLSEITISELWQKYFVHKLRRYSSLPEYEYWVLITKAINESPVQTLVRGEEIFRFVLNKYGSDLEFASEFELEMICCTSWAFKEKIIDEDTFCDFHQKSEDYVHINAFGSQSNDENVTEDEMTMKSDCGG